MSNLGFYITVQVSASGLTVLFNGELVQSGGGLYAIYIYVDGVRVFSSGYSGERCFEYRPEKIEGWVEVVGFLRFGGRIFSRRVPVGDENISHEFEKRVTGFGDKLKRLGVSGYYVKILEASGFGDALTLANMSAYFCDCLGLQYNSVLIDVKNGFSRPHYLDLWQRLGVNPVEVNKNVQSVPFSNLDDLWEGIERLCHSKVSLEGNFLCIIPKNVLAFEGCEKIGKFPRDFLLNSFNDWFLDRFTSRILPSSNSAEEKYDIDLLFHVRLGDVGALKLGHCLINPFEFSRRGKGIYNTLECTGDANVLSDFGVLEKIERLVVDIRMEVPDIRIGLVTDLYGDGVKILLSEEILRRLACEGIGCSDSIVNDAVNDRLSVIRRISFDTIVAGDSNSDEFIAAVSCILKSKIIFSSARTFIFNVLSNFKCNHGSYQKFYANMRKSYVGALSHKNVEIEDCRCFDLEALKFDVDGFPKR